MTSRLRLALAVGLLAAFGLSGAGGCQTETLCIAGSDVFCRCPGTNEPGTKRCHPDGMGFDECIGAHGTCEAAPTVCALGEVVFCTCDGTDSGTKQCLSDQSGFEDCSCSGGGGAGGSAGSKILFEPCVADAECESGLCPMGFCTKECFAYDECFLGTGECIPLDATIAACFPNCEAQPDCDVYGAPSECGFASAIDGVGVTVCADWLAALELPPDGSACGDDLDCHLGHDGAMRICDGASCTDGCHTDSDCPGVLLCSTSNGSPGFCE